MIGSMAREPRESAEDETLRHARGACQYPAPGAAPVSSAEEPRVRNRRLLKPQLNWTNAEGQLNEVAAGRVVVVPPPAHSRQE